MKHILTISFFLLGIHYFFGQSCSVPFVPVDASFTLALGPSDDGSSQEIQLPFNFCYFGSNKTSLFINNNGVVSFGNAFSITNGFLPSSSYGIDIIAPFWADVHTQNGLGQVFYKITPTSIIITYDSVGYFNLNGDKRNTFQVILTNGADPLIQDGNLSFRFEDMQWACGDASGGVNGFNGIPGITGVNSATGSNFLKIGGFNQNNSSYYGPNGIPGGINWLDNKSFDLNICGSDSPILSGGSLGCDTIPLCAVGDTLVFPVNIYTQNALTPISVVFDNGGLNAAQYIHNPSSGSISDTLIISNPIGLQGYYTLSFTAIAQGTTSDTATFQMTVFIDTSASLNVLNSSFFPSQQLNCLPAQISFTPLLNNNSISYQWNFGDPMNVTDTSSSIIGNYTYTQAGAYPVTLVLSSTQFCGSGIDSTTILLQIEGISDTTYLDTLCTGDTLILESTNYDLLTWTPNTYLQVLPNLNAAVFPPASSIFIAQKSKNGCLSVDTFSVQVYDSPIINFDPVSSDTLCTNSIPVLLSAIPPNGIFYGPGVIGDTFVPSLSGAGDFSISYIYTNLDGCSSEAQQSVQVEACLGIPEPSKEFFTIVYPNPSAGLFNFTFSDPIKKTLIISDLFGRQLEQHHFYETTFQLDLSKFSNGIYSVEIDKNGVYQETLYLYKTE